jgi:SAM-dependent methyltransferase
MNNYEFCVKWVLKNGSTLGSTALDYGCGSGKIVSKLRDANYPAFGCDLFYGGGDYSPQVDPKLWGVAIRKIDSSTGTIPFDSGTFDFVVNNMVLEHVPDIDKVISEIHRVLKPGGVVLSLFPDKGVWREGHCGIPMLHWFRRGSSFRVWYAFAFRLMGLGYHKAGKGRLEWSRFQCEWLDKWTHYRTKKEVHSKFSEKFTNIAHIEDLWFSERLGSPKYLSLMPGFIKSFIARRLCTMVFTASKRS